MFSDDEDVADLLSAACVRSLDQDGSGEGGGDGDEGKQSSPTKTGSESTVSSSSSNSRDRERKDKGLEVVGKGKKREERVIIIDVNETGDGILSANSLSANWQILSSSLSSAPTFDGQVGEEDAEGGDRGLMLRVEGVGIDVGDDGDGNGGEKEGLGIEKRAGGSGMIGEEEMQGLLDGFDRKMGVLRKIVGEGWGGIGAVGIEAGGEEEKETGEKDMEGQD